MIFDEELGGTFSMDLPLSEREKRSLNDAESRSVRASTITRTIHKKATICERCRLNDDPRKVPVHPHCDCDVVTDGVETGVVDNDHPLFRALSTATEDMLFVGADADTVIPPGILLDPASTAILDAEDMRFGDIARWLESVQPYIEQGAQYVSIVVDDDTNEAAQNVADTLDQVASGAEDVTEAIKSRKLWLSIAKAVVL